MLFNIGKDHLSLNKSWINNFSFYWHFCNEPCFPELFYREIWTEAIDLVVSIPRPWKMCNKFDIDNTKCPFIRILYQLSMLKVFIEYAKQFCITPWATRSPGPFFGKFRSSNPSLVDSRFVLTVFWAWPKLIFGRWCPKFSLRDLRYVEISYESMKYIKLLIY